MKSFVIAHYTVVRGKIRTKTLKVLVIMYIHFELSDLETMQNEVKKIFKRLSKEVVKLKYSIRTTNEKVLHQREPRVLI